MTDPAKTWLWRIVRLLVMAALVVYVASQAHFRDGVRVGPPGEPVLKVLERTDEGVVVRRPEGGTRLVPEAAFERGEAVYIAGIPSMARRVGARWGWALAAVAVMLLQTPLGAIRWRMLLRVQGLRLSLLDSLRLTYIGWFFSSWMPGATGGDLVKAWYIARETHRKAEAVTVVFLDRIIGVVSLALMGGLAVLYSLDDPRIRIPQYVIAAIVAGVFVGTMVFYSRRLRRLVRLDALLTRLPAEHTIARVDRALFIYRRHPRIVVKAIAMSWLTQLVGLLATFFVALALGGHMKFYHVVINMPVVWIGWSLIPVPGGFGVAETLAQQLFGPAVLGGAAGRMTAPEAATLALAMILGYRVVQTLVSTPGGVLYLARRTGVSPRHMMEEMEAVDGGAEADGAATGQAGPAEPEDRPDA